MNLQDTDELLAATPAPATDWSVRAIEMIARCFHCDPGVLSTLLVSGISKQQQGDVLERLVRLKIIDRIAARAIMLILEGRLDERDLRQLGSSSYIRTAINRIKEQSRTVACDRPPLLKVGMMLGRYKIERIIGTGGCGVVYRSTHPELGIPVAVKQSRPDRFEAERRSLTQLRQANIVRLWDVASTDHGPILVLEYVKRGSLKHHLQKRGQWPARRVFRMLADMSRALLALQRHQLIHGDIKPGNILLDEHGQHRLADFGLAQNYYDLGLSQQTILKGSWPYSAPERFEGFGDHRADIYSLGLTTIHLLTGVLPVRGQSAAECLEAHRNLQVDPLHWTHADVPRPLSMLIQKMIRPDPETRLTDLRDVIHEVQRISNRRTNSQ